MFAFIGIPAMSASLFMLAGLLIGYLLWHRAATPRTSQRDGKPADSPPEKLRPPFAHDRQAEKQQVQDRQTIRDCRGQIDQLSQIRDRLATANYELTRQRDDYASELERLRPQLDTATKQLTEAQGNIERQENELHGLREEQATTGEVLQKTQRELGDVRNINEQLQAAIDEQATEFEELTQRLADKAHVEEKIEETERCVEALRLELGSKEETIDEQRQAIEAAAQEKSQLIASVEALQPLATQLPEREAEVERLRQSLDRLESDELQPLRSQLESMTDELQLKQDTTRELAADLQQKTSALRELQSNSQRIWEERNVLQRSNEKLKRRLTELTASVGAIEQQLTAAEEQNQQTMAAQANAAETMQRQVERIAKLQDEAKRGELYRQKVELFEAKVRQLTAALRQVGGEPHQQEAIPGNPSHAPEATNRAA